MTQQSSTQARVLFVDNREGTLTSWYRILQKSGYTTFLYFVQDANWKKECLIVARKARPHVVVLDLRLEDDYRLSDDSGLQLLRELRRESPATQCVVYSSYLDTDLARQIGEAGAEFFKKGGAPLELLKIVERLARKASAATRISRIEWPDSWDQQNIVDRLLETTTTHSIESLSICEDLVHQLFSDAHHLTVEHFEGKFGVGPEPVSIGNSIVGYVQRDDFPVKKILKIATSARIAREKENYDKYVRNTITNVNPIQLEKTTLFWDLGASVYSFLSAGNRELQSFSDFFSRAGTEKQAWEPISRFFGETWRYHYANTSLSNRSLDDEYTEYLGLEDKIAGFDVQQLALNETGENLVNPVQWLQENKANCGLQSVRQAVTHGNFKGDNLFTDGETLWVINFEYMGQGHILRDFTSLEVSTVINAVPPQFSFNEISHFMRLLFSAGVDSSKDYLLLEPAARKLYEFVRLLRQAAREITAFESQSEYLWSLLYTSVDFLLQCFSSGDERNARNAYVLAGILCEILEGKAVSDNNRYIEVMPLETGLPAVRFFRTAGLQIETKPPNILWITQTADDEHEALNFPVYLVDDNEHLSAEHIDVLAKVMEDEGVTAGYVVFQERLTLSPVRAIWEQRTRHNRVIVPLNILRLNQEVDRYPAEARRFTPELARDNLVAWLMRLKRTWQNPKDPYRLLDDLGQQDPQWFFGRQRIHDVQSVVEDLQNSRKAILIHGMRRIGKSYFANQLVRDFFSKASPVIKLVCARDRHGTGTANILGDVVSATEELLHVRRGVQDDAPVSEYLQMSKGEFVRRMQKLLQQLDSDALILILDEMDELLPRADDFLEAVERYITVGQALKELVESPQGARVVLVVTAEGKVINNKLIQYRSADGKNVLFEDNPLYGRFFPYPISFLDRADFDELVTVMGSMVGLDYTEEALNTLYEATAGHPQIVRDACQRVIEVDRELQTNGRIDKDLVNRACKKYLGKPLNPEIYLRQTLWADRMHFHEETQQMILSCLADRGPLSRGDLVLVLHEMSADLTEKKILDCLTYLKDRSILREDDASQRLSLSVPLFQDWIRQITGRGTRYDVL